MSALYKRIRDFYYRFKPLQDYYGEDFKRNFDFLLESQEWSRTQMQEYKLACLRKLLVHARDHVPYYGQLFAEHQIDISRIQSFEDFAKLPVLTKDIIRKHGEAFKADNFESYKPVIAKTSGTTGHTTTVYRSRELEDFRKACMWRFYTNHGINFGDLRMTVFNPGAYSPEAPYFDYDKLENKVNIFTYHIFARDLDPLLDLIRKFKPRMIWAHPNVFSVLAEYILDQNLEPINIPVVATYGELIDPHIKAILTRGFPARYIEYYGNRENTVGAWGLSDQTFYEMSEYCHLEVEDGAGEGDIISTSLHNYAFPMIRYKPEDYIEWLGYTDDNLPYPKFKLIGARGKNLLLSRNGIICPYALYYMERHDFYKLKMFQLEQVSLDEVIARIVPRENFDPATDSEILANLIDRALLGNFKVIVEVVENIPFTEYGKYKPVISTLAMEYIKEVSGQ